MADPQLFVGVDLDNTLLNTHVFFYDNVLPQLAQAYPDLIKPEDFIVQMDDYRAPVGAANYYDFFSQIRALGLSEDDVEQLILKTVGGNQLLTSGTEEFLQVMAQKNQPVDIVSIGFERYQRLKQRCVPALADLPLHVTLEPKGQFINQKFPDRHGYLIDDKPVPDLPPNITYLHLATKEHSTEASYHDFHDLLARGPAELVQSK